MNEEISEKIKVQIWIDKQIQKDVRNQIKKKYLYRKKFY